MRMPVPHVYGTCPMPYSPTADHARTNTVNHVRISGRVGIAEGMPLCRHRRAACLAYGYTPARYTFWPPRRKYWCPRRCQHRDKPSAMPTQRHAYFFGRVEASSPMVLWAHARVMSTYCILQRKLKTVACNCGLRSGPTGRRHLVSPSATDMRTDTHIAVRTDICRACAVHRWKALTAAVIVSSASYTPRASR